MTGAEHEAVVLSDFHIGNGYKTCWYQPRLHDEQLNAALNWVIARRSTVREVILLGDIFDVWTYPPSIRPPSMKEICDANPVLLGSTGSLAALVKAFPNRVRLLLGNHDGTFGRVDVEYLNKRLGGNLSKGEAIQFVGCPVLVTRAGRTATAFAHGHHWCMFNAPDTKSPWGGALPVGHLVSRAIAHKWERDLKPGETVADLAGMGNHLTKCQDWTKFLRLYLQGGDKLRRKLVAHLLDYMRCETGMKATDPVQLPGGGMTTMAEAETAFADLWARWEAQQGRPVDADRAALADKDGRFLAWFAQRVALQTNSNLIVMGHTHEPVRGMELSPVNYINSGYACVSGPDRKTRSFTFTLVDLRTAAAQLFKVVPGDPKKGTPPTVRPAKTSESKVLRPIVSPAVDYSCYVRVRNETARPLTRTAIARSQGHWIVPPPEQIPAGGTAHGWLQDRLGIKEGSVGSFEYRSVGVRWPLHFEVACPTDGRNRLKSPVPRWETSTNGRTWKARKVAWGTPLMSRFDIERRLPEQPTPQQQIAAAHADYLELGRLIMRQQKVDSVRGEVMSHVHLIANDGKPLMDTATKPVGRGRIELTNPPEHTGPAVFRITSDVYGQFDYVLIHPADATAKPAIGGYLFLPADGSPNLHLVSFNVRKLDQSFNEACTNAHHAEMQITNWITMQRGSRPKWQNRIGWISLSNGARTRRPGYSPCNYCCDDLHHFLTTLNDWVGRKSPCLARASWGQLYFGNARCRHPTTKSGIDKLTAAGWELQDPMPAGTVLPKSAKAKPDDPKWRDKDSTR